MTRSVSIYLDFIRLWAALFVFFFHASYARFDGQWLNPLGNYGHDAVRVFFVLSGFVIAYCGVHKNHTLSDFSSSRLARLYSVVLPALLLTLIADAIGKHIDPALYSGGYYISSEPTARFFANFFFLNEIWFSSWRAFSNGPFWSMGYEFWYYVIFAAFFYPKGKIKYIAAIIALLIAGPKIALLFPVWLLGVLVYYLNQKVTIRKTYALCFAIIPIMLYVVFLKLHVHHHLITELRSILGKSFVNKQLHYSRFFLSDFIVGVLFAMHLFGACALLKNITIPKFVGTPIRYFSGSTFSLYLFHYPLMMLYFTLFQNGVLSTALTFFTVLLISPITEGKKAIWKHFFDAAIKSFSKKLSISFAFLKKTRELKPLPVKPVN